MKKTSKVFGALAVSAALAMGTMGSAFAAPTVGTEKGDLKDEANSTTIVELEAIASQINATIPLNVTVVADIDGVEQMVTPSEGAYKITNNSTSGRLFVTGVEATLSNADVDNPSWNAANTNSPEGVSSSPNTADSTPAIGSVCLTLTSGELVDGMGDDAGKKVFGTTTNDSIVLVGKTPKTSPNDWVVAKKTGDVAGELGLKIEGGNSKLSNISTEESSAQELVKVKYTVTMTVPGA